MKKVLISDNYPLFRDFLKQKLSEEQIEVITTQENRDLQTKMLTTLPNLIILYVSAENDLDIEFLEKKSKDLNTTNIPVIVTGPKKERSAIAALAKYGVIKYFEKPVQFDLLFKSIEKILRVSIPLDATPCIFDIHCNDKTIFIEFSLGLNREKISLLHFKLSEIIETEKIESPKIVIMLTNLELSFIDGSNLEFLIDAVISCPRVYNRNVKILSLNPFVKEFIDGHPNYAEIETAGRLKSVLNDLVDTSIYANLSDVIADRILAKNDFENSDQESMMSKFSSDAIEKKIATNAGAVLHIAIIDSNKNYLKSTKETFEQIGAICKCFSTGNDFFKNYAESKFDLIILDIVLEDKTGLSLLQALQKKSNSPPIIIYSSSLPKDLIIKILSSGVKSYVVKPQKPDVLIKKALSTLKM